MADENNPAPVEIPAPVAVPPENPAPPAVAPVAASAAPPAAALVVHGEVTDERILAAERRARTAEMRAAELERDNEELKKVVTPAAAPVPAAKKKVKRYLISPILGADEEVEAES